MSITLRLPSTFDRIRAVAAEGAFGNRNTVIAELTMLNGFRPSEVAALNLEDVDLSGLRVQRIHRGKKQWQPLIMDSFEAWTILFAEARGGKESPAVQSWQGSRISRIDVWRVLRALGKKAGIKKPLHARRIRRVLAYTLARRHGQRAEVLAHILALKGLQGVSTYLPSVNWTPLTDLQT